jgi:hypothetical protein
MLVRHAEQAGMKAPTVKQADMGEYDPNEFPHFTVFATLHLGRRIPFPSAVSGNASLIAGIPEDQIRTVTVGEVLEMGYS